jgi:hypothetical protein
VDKPDGWPEGFKRTNLKIFIDVDGVLTPVEPDDIRLLELKEVMISFHRLG